MEKEELYYEGVQVTLEEWAVLELVRYKVRLGETIPKRLLEAEGVVRADINDRKNRPEIGDICALWDTDTGSVVICKLCAWIPNTDYPYRSQSDVVYRHCKKITDQSIIDFYNTIKGS